MLFRSLHDSRIGLTLGAATAGTPFPSRTVPLTAGRFLSVPQYPPGIRPYQPAATIPLIPVAPLPVAEFNRLSGEGPGNDLCLQRACDLIVSLAELKAKQP